MNTRLRGTPRRGWHTQGWVPFALFGVPDELDAMRQLVTESSRFVDVGAEAFRLRVEDRLSAAGLQGEDADAFHEAHEVEFTRWTTGFPRMIRSTMLIAGCSLLESGLMALCKDIERQGAVRVSTHWRDISRDAGVRRASRFLRDNLGIETDRYPGWSTILDLFAVRDCLVHAGGQVDDMRDPAALRLVVARLGGTGIRVSDYGDLELETPFVLAALDDFTAFWAAITNAFVENDVTGPLYWP